MTMLALAMLYCAGVLLSVPSPLSLLVEEGMEEEEDQDEACYSELMKL